MAGTQEHPDSEQHFHRRMARPGLFVDIGAFNGDFTFGLTDIPGLEFLAIEPFAPAVKAIESRAMGRSLPLRILNAALSDRPGRMDLAIPVIATGPVWTWGSIVKNFDALRAKFPDIVDVLHVPVPVTTLDALRLNDVTGIKLDAEGAEQEVILGARDTLQRSRPVISIELEERHRSGCTVAVPSLMDGWGYECYFETEGNLLPLSGFQKDAMQRSSGSPADMHYSRPYVYCFYFIPKEDADLRQRLFDGYSLKST